MNSNMKKVFYTETCALKRKSDHYQKYQRHISSAAAEAAVLPTVSHRHQRRRPQRRQRHRPQLHHQQPNSSTMSLNKTLKVFVNGAWITWIYLVAIFIRLDYADAKIGKFEFYTKIHFFCNFKPFDDQSPTFKDIFEVCPKSILETLLKTLGRFGTVKYYGNG